MYQGSGLEVAGWDETGVRYFPIPTAFFALLGTRRETRKTGGKGQAWPEGRSISC